ncbi:MAG TPA: PAC2 family protein [Candidatus Saccharimonadales bacterium]|nr:PAC2 family protein [Candidatus Saccharimonadales bacterium]
MIQIKMDGDQNLKGYTLLEAFPGVGLVGAMAGSYIIEKLKMEDIGRIESDYFPPISAIHGAVPMFPARIYKSEEMKLILFMAEFAIPAQLIYQLSQEMLSFARKYGISRIVSVGGLPSQKPSTKIYVVSSEPSVSKSAAKLGILPIQDGLIAGVSASLLTYSREYGIPTMDILVEVNPQLVDPKYAELAITGLNKLLEIEIDLSELHKEAALVEARIKEMIKKLKDHPDAAAASAPPPPGGDQSMYA